MRRTTISRSRIAMLLAAAALAGAPVARAQDTLQIGRRDTLQIGPRDTLQMGVPDTLRMGGPDTLRMGGPDTLQMGVVPSPDTLQMGVVPSPDTLQMGVVPSPDTLQMGVMPSPDTLQMGVVPSPDTLQMGVVPSPDTLQMAVTPTPDTLQLGVTPTVGPLERPQVHVVQLGETLWGLSRLYLGDPLLWPEIYRLNTAVVEDPHWIYPGEELNLGGMAPPPVGEFPVEPPPEEPPGVVVLPGEPLTDTTQVAMQPPQPVEEPPVEAPTVEAPPPPPPPPTYASGPTIFSQRARRAGGANITGARGALSRYRAVRRGEFYGAGFLTEGTSFPWGKVLGDASEPPVDRTRQTSSVTIYQTVELEAPGGATYQVGDSLLTAQLARDVPGWGRVVVPSGIVRVTHVNGREVLGEVVTQFHRVVDGQVVIPLEPFLDPGFRTPVPVENGLQASVIGLRDLHAVPIQQNIVFIDAGETEGVALGDLFEVMQPVSVHQPETLQASALLQIVHVRDRSASGLLLEIYQPGIQPGQSVRLIRKMPS